MKEFNTKFEAKNNYWKKSDLRITINNKNEKYLKCFDFNQLNHIKSLTIHGKLFDKKNIRIFNI